MGKTFGQLAYIRHIITFSLSPFEQRAFPNFFSNGFPNLVRRFRGQIFRIGPPFALLYIAFDWTTKTHQALLRKNPADYINDE
uniref:Cytochrome b-c1 complex subunit 8 n=1 Tax=Eptatretus burgeri TaxID=7764 RepID=A0A8C4R632_EPTBU